MRTIQGGFFIVVKPTQWYSCVLNRETSTVNIQKILLADLAVAML